MSGSTALTGFSPLFRPAGPPCNVGGQPFLQFPFIRRPGPNFGLTGNAIAPPFVSRIGTPNGGNGSFGAASNFPGIGSSVGSILPGIVLATVNLTCTAPTGNCSIADGCKSTVILQVPAHSRSRQAYLPDAPFVNRLYGESSFTDMVVGAKIRLASQTTRWDVGFIPFYRWDRTKLTTSAASISCNAALVRARDIGDFGVIGFVDGRLSQHVNVSANIGYILNSNPKSDAMGGAVLLRPSG